MSLVWQEPSVIDRKKTEQKITLRISLQLR